MKLNSKNLAYNIIMAFVLAFVVSAFFSVGTAVTAGAGLLAVGCLLPAQPANATTGLAFMAIQKEIWIEDIAENIFPDNSFMKKCRDDSANMAGRVVHVPQAGAAPAAQKNRVGAANGANKRTDTTNDYVVDEFTTDPSVVTITEEIEVSYPKRASVLYDHIETLRTIVADSMVYNWATTLGANIIRTSGAARAAYKSYQAGPRLRVAKEDFANASRLMNRMDIPQEGRVALVDADLLMDLMLIPEFVSANIFGGANGAQKEGVLGRVFGFDIMTRSRTIAYTAAGAPKDLQAAPAATDGASIQFWHPMYVRGAMGSKDNGGIMVFEQNGSPTNYGDVFSAMVRAGGKIHRSDQRGVITLVEAAG